MHLAGTASRNYLFTMVHALDESLTNVSVAYEEEWRTELARRAAALDDGSSRLIPGEEVMASVDESFARVS
jgi:putative addiction module component (TIGR02574 family)